mmetsp:Transcript_18107/g.49384  ORF Transcript_18107/g.49384 Transcript_18107/m.49384 type:complete len:132 (+) Transcript_18107:101-496(+)
MVDDHLSSETKDYKVDDDKVDDLTVVIIWLLEPRTKSSITRIIRSTDTNCGDATIPRRQCDKRFWTQFCWLKPVSTATRIQIMASCPFWIHCLLLLYLPPMKAPMFLLMMVSILGFSFPDLLDFDTHFFHV